jgi:hypothetical protein
MNLDVRGSSLDDPDADSAAFAHSRDEKGRLAAYSRTLHHHVQMAYCTFDGASVRRVVRSGHRSRMKRCARCSRVNG